MNKVQLIGRLTKEPEIRYSQSAEPIAITRFSVAVSRKFKKDGEPDADFINCISFGKTAEFIGKYFNKGRMIGVVGCIRTNSWTDNNGNNRKSIEVQVEEAEFLEKKESLDTNTLNQEKSFGDSEEVDNEVKNDEDELPY